jgi:hypothetical protein
MSAEADANVLLGSDGKRIGMASHASAEASPIGGDMTAEANIPLPFKNWTISIRGKTGGSLGAGATSHALKDVETGRYHLGLGAKLGLELDFDISVGPPYTNRERSYDP